MARYLCRTAPLLLAAVLLLALAPGRGSAQEGPSIVITAPAEGEVIPGLDVTVSVEFSGFTISLPLEPKREPNTGHIVYFLDVAPFFDAPVPLGNDNMIHSGRPSETFPAVPDGEHTIYVCLVYDDNTCIDPALTDSVRITVGQPPPTPTPPPEPTPTPEPPQETPTPPPPSPAPTGEPPPSQPPLADEPPSAIPTPTPLIPRPTPPPPTAPPPTPVPGIAPATADSESAGDGFPWLYVGLGIALTALAAVAAAGLWRVRQASSRR
ncbi:MAG: hypothetical protein ACUVV3_02960 [Dehalococcoidia bacterium]